MNSSQRTTGSRWRVVSIGALIIAGFAGVLAATSSTDKVTASSFKSVLLTAAPAPARVPTFRFDDAEAVQSNQHGAIDALASLDKGLDNRLKRPDSQTFERQSFAELFTPPASAGTAPDTRAPDTRAPDTQSADASSAFPPADAHTVTTLAAETLFSEELALVDKSVSQSEHISTEQGPRLTPLVEKLPTQKLALPQQRPELKDNYHKLVVVKAGDTFLEILSQQGFPSDKLNRMLNDEVIKKNLSHLQIGDKLNFEYRWDGLLDNISVKVKLDTRIRIQNDSSGQYTVEKIHLPLEHERVVTSGTIDQSLYLAAERAQLKQSTIMELADIFEWELDFARDIRKGDRFSIVYDRLYRDGKYVGDGKILAATFKQGDRTHSAIRFTDDEGNSDYYSPDGQSKRRAFMRHPVDVVRITSRFDPNRLHPVLHKIRAHKGVDYGSPRGTPIYATGDGKVAHAGDRNAYGNTVILQHGDNRSTLYAHMSKISRRSKVGARVKRGEVIGYVGKSGRVTGVHLHYEFRIAGKHVDPLKIELPGAPPLDKIYHAKLKATANELFEQMRSVLPHNDTVALSD